MKKVSKRKTNSLMAVSRYDGHDSGITRSESSFLLKASFINSKFVIIINRPISALTKPEASKILGNFQELKNVSKFTENFFKILLKIL